MNNFDNPEEVMDIPVRPQGKSANNKFAGSKKGRKPYDQKPGQKNRRQEPLDKQQANQRRGGADFNKITIPKSLNAAPERSYFPVFVSNHGVRKVVARVYATLAAKIRQFGVTEDDLRYITHLSWLNRVVQINISNGTGFYESSSYLKQAAGTLLLPEPIANFIETLGNVEMLNGIIVSPFFESYEAIITDSELEPKDQMYELAGQDVPDGQTWPINRQVILAYNANISRATLKGLPLRVVDSSNISGKSAFLVSKEVRRVAPEYYIGRAPQVISDAEAQMGAAYEWRDWTQRGQWPGVEDFNLLLTPNHSSNGFDPELLLSSMVATTMMGKTTQF